MKLSKLVKSGLVAIVGLFLAFNVNAGEAGPYSKDWTGTAAEGYDVVAYFTVGQAVEGSKDFVHEWNGSKWRFASDENRQMFAANPEKYAPQYGGYCAYAVSKGYTASVDPEAFSVVDGKLYLNYSQDVKSTWEQDVPGYISKAEKFWPTVREKL